MMSIAGYSRLKSLAVEVQSGGMEGFLVGCRPRPAVVAPSCFFLVAGAGASVPRIFVTGHMQYNVICTSWTNTNTVVCSIDRRRGSLSSLFSHASNICRAYDELATEGWSWGAGSRGIPGCARGGPVHPSIVEPNASGGTGYQRAPRASGCSLWISLSANAMSVEGQTWHL